jgi:MFS family permease
MNTPNTNSKPGQPFFGWRVVAGAFVVALFGWGLGFYGPPIYLHAVREMRGWSVGLVSAAVTLHYLIGAIVVANLPKLYRHFGLVKVTRAGSVLLAIGLVGWALAEQPWQLFLATMLTGCGWVTLGAAAINAMVAPWFVLHRPKALSTAYNGASVGGILFSPLWVALIAWLGFAQAAALIGAITVAMILWLTAHVVGQSPAERGQQPDGATAPAAASPNASTAATGAQPALWTDWRFQTLAAGMALGLFAQIGLLAHLFSLIVPALGEGWASLVAAMATASAIAGRTVFGWSMPPGADRRLWAASSYTLQIAGMVLLAASGLQTPGLIIAGVLLFGFGIGNATSLPPLIAQAEFGAQAGRAVPLIVAIAQAAYAFAPALFGLIREAAPSAIAPLLGVAITIKLCAILALLAGIKRPRGNMTE